MYVCSCGNLEGYVHKEGADLSQARMSPGCPLENRLGIIRVKMCLPRGELPTGLAMSNGMKRKRENSFLKLRLLRPSQERW